MSDDELDNIIKLLHIGYDFMTIIDEGVYEAPPHAIDEVVRRVKASRRRVN